VTELPDLVAVLELGATDLDAGGENGGFSLLDHGLQCAMLLRAARRDDLELQVAGLVHDIGQTLTGNDDASHGVAAARFVEPLLGPRVAGLVELHVPAKRYLVSVDPSYARVLSAASQLSLMHQGATMTATEVEDFQQNPWHADAVRLRRADDAAKVAGAQVPALRDWLPAVNAVFNRFRDLSANSP
jgi:predicted HD phosphohydrolase